MSASPNFYLIGTKYDRSEDVLPAMILHGVISTGFAEHADLTPILGKSYAEARAWTERTIPSESGRSKSTLARFAGIKPGDVVALKAHSAPSGKQARLVIARYAVVTGEEVSSYAKLSKLGHTLKVDFLDEQELFELNFGYGQTLHSITDLSRIEQIFGRYGAAARSAATLVDDKATHTSEVSARGAYLMQRVHNEIQNELYRDLVRRYGVQHVALEESHVDLIVRLPLKTLLIEVKSSLSPVACVREALGQLLQYSWTLGFSGANVHYVVVGPSVPNSEDRSFIEHVIMETKIKLVYCTLATFHTDLPECPSSAA